MPSTTIPSTTSSPTKVLAERSPNTTSLSSSKPDTPDYKVKEKTFNKPIAMFQTGQEQQQQPSEDTTQQRQQQQSAVQEPGQTYHSPSDNILSPTSKKLSEIKGKRFASGKPQSLFAKTVRKEGMKSQDKLLSAGGIAKD